MKIIDNILKEASFEGDKKLNDTAKNIVAELVNRIKNNKKITRINGGVWTKIGELEFYIFNKNSNNSYQAARTGVRAEFTGNLKNPIVQSYQNILSKDNFHIDESYIYHEVIHYLNLKRGKDKDFMNRSGEKQVKGREEYAKATGKEKAEKHDQLYKDYYNSPAEFNTHFMQYVYNNIEHFVLNKANLGSYDDFKNTIINGEAKHFFNNLDDKNKKKFLKRLYIVYNNITKNEKINDNIGDNYKDATKKQRVSILQKIKNLFSKNAA